MPTVEIMAGTIIKMVSDGTLHVETEPPIPPIDPPVEPPEPSGTYCGAHPDVETLSLDVSGYPIPQAKGPIIKPEQFGARGDGTSDDTDAVRSAINAVPADGGTVELSGRYGIRESNAFNRKFNLTIAGAGPDTGFVNLNQGFPGSRWRCGLEFHNSINLVLRDFSYDGNNQKIGCIYHGADDNTWMVSLYVFGVNGGPTSGTTPLAAIKGAGMVENFSMVGCKIDNTWGKADANSGVRGYWGGDVHRGTGIEHCIFRKCGHTGVSFNPDSNCHITHITATDNEGAGFKPEIPTTRNPDWTPPTVCWTQRSYFAGNGFTGIQFECPGQLIANNLFRNQRRGLTSWNRSRSSTIKACSFENISEYGVFFDNTQGNELQDLFLRDNTMEGTYSACVHFADKCDRWGGRIEIIDNKVTRGVRTTPSLRAYPGYIEADNDGNAQGSPTDWLHP